MKDQDTAAPSDKEQREPLTHEQALQTLKLTKIYEYCAANPKEDPYVAVTAKLLRQFPEDEEQIVLNFIDALSFSNLKMKAIIANQAIEMEAMIGKSKIIPENQNVVRGQGPIPIRRK